MGCPCDTYTCDPEKKAILILNDENPILIDHAGNLIIIKFALNFPQESKFPALISKWAAIHPFIHHVLPY